MKLGISILLMILIGIMQGVCCMQMQPHQMMDAACCDLVVDADLHDEVPRQCDCSLKKHADRVVSDHQQALSPSMVVSASYFDLHPGGDLDDFFQDDGVVVSHRETDQERTTPSKKLGLRLHLAIQVQVI